MKMIQVFCIVQTIYAVVTEPPPSLINGSINRYSVLKQLPLTLILTTSFVLSGSSLDFVTPIGALYKQFEPYSTVSVFFLFLGLLCLLQAGAQQTRRGTVLWSDFIIFLLLWLMLDKRQPITSLVFDM